MPDLPLLVTVDDGPDPVWTERFLDVLVWRDTHAILMVTGEHAQMHPHLVRRAVAEGHLLGVHSWDHADPADLTEPEQDRQTDRTLNLLVDLVGRDPVRFWRPPYGRATARGLRHAEAVGLQPLGWGAGAGDWRDDLDLARWERAVDEVMGSSQVPVATVPGLPMPVPDNAVTLLIHDAQGENHDRGSVDRWRSCQLLSSLADRYPTADPHQLLFGAK